MNLIELMNAYEQASLDILSPQEQVVWLRLVLIWNHLKRPEAFAVSRAELMRVTGIKSAKTIDKAREGLEIKGFIKSWPTGRTRPREYVINNLQTRVSDTLTKVQDTLEENTKQTETRVSDTLTKVQDTLEEKQLGYEIPQHKGMSYPKLGYVVPTSHSKSNTENIIESSSDYSTNSIDVGAAPEKNPTTTIPEKVLNFYQQEIRPVCSPYELERLEEIVKRYGEEQVVEAIKRSVLRNKRQLGYVEGILKRWETDGMDDEDEWRNSNVRELPGRARKNTRQRPKKYTTVWGNETSGWD